MAGRGRAPPSHLHHPFHGHGVGHPDPYASGMHPSSGGFPPLEMLPPADVMEQKLSAQHMEIQKLATENQRLAATHGDLRQELATANNELQSIHAHIADTKAHAEQQARGILDKMSMMEAELQGADRIKTDLQKARAEAQSLLAARQELVSKVQQLTRDLQMAHSDAQQIPSLMSELDSLRQEYHHSRATYEHEKKLCGDHFESLQVMEKNYMAMAREVDKLRAELTNSASFDPRTGRPYVGSGGYSDSYTMGNYPSCQNAYAVAQGQSPLQGGGSGGKAAVSAGAGAGAGGNSPHVVSQPAPTGSVAARDASKGPDYSTSRGTAYDPQADVETGYDPKKGPTGAGPNHYVPRGSTGAGPNHNAPRGPTGAGPNQNAPRGPTGAGPNHNSPRGPSVPGYDAQMRPTGPGYDAQMRPPGPGYDAQMRPPGPGYDAQMRPPGPGYNAQMRPTGPGYTAHWGPGAAPAYEPQRGYGYEVQRTQPVYDGQRAAPSYDMQRGSGTEVQKGGGNYDIQKNSGYDPSSRSGVRPSGGQVSTPTPSSKAGSGREPVSRGGNPTRR